MASNWIWTVIGTCLLLIQPGVMAQYLYSECGLTGPGMRITGGKDAVLGSAPFMAYLMKNNKYQCGGSIVNNRYVLTAAHCVDQHMTVRLGEWNVTSNPDCGVMKCMPEHEDFGIDHIRYHYKYSRFTQVNDIALIRLNRNINFQDHIQPICLHLNPSNVLRVNEYKAYGWGVTSNGSESAVLQTTTLYPYPRSLCKDSFRRSLTYNQICAGSNHSDTCGGDSGSPLVTKVTGNDNQERYVQLGLVSLGVRRCIGAGAYTYVPNYASWIFDNIQRINHQFAGNFGNVH